LHTVVRNTPSALHLAITTRIFTMSGIKNVFGAASIRKDRGMSSPELLEEVYKALEQGDCKIIDTAKIYGESEEYLGNTGAGKRFVSAPFCSTKDDV
jgi:diketogulonate reductase-like aldo/keto reductase